MLILKPSGHAEILSRLIGNKLRSGLKKLSLKIAPRRLLSKIFTLLLPLSLSACVHPNQGSNSIVLSPMWSESKSKDREVIEALDEFREITRTYGVETKALRILKKVYIADSGLIKLLAKKIEDYSDGVVALTFQGNFEGEPFADVFLDSRLLSDKKEFKLFLFHELLHILGFQHPSTDCHWLQFGCGMMGMSPYPRAIDSDTYRRTIEVTFVKSKASEK